MTFRQAALALLPLTLTGCVSYPDISQSRSPCRMEPGGWCGFVREAAVEAWPFALAATNAYTGDHDVFGELGDTLAALDRLQIDEEAIDKGFGYELFAQYRKNESGERELAARILSFRGTDFNGLTDIFYGTLRSDHIELALAAFEAERARFDDSVSWVVTGHSLGGALATEISIRYPDVRAYMFNTSPFYRGDGMTNDIRRMVFNERGELLRRFARFDEAPAAEAFTLNCGPRKSTFTKHKIRPLADCITWIAAYDSAEAQAVVSANGVRKPMVECGPEDKPHPGPGYRESEPCVHQARRDEEADGESD